MMEQTIQYANNLINVERDTYIFICANTRDKRKACANCLMIDGIYEHFRQSINSSRSMFKDGRIVKVNKTGCLSRCADGPNIVIFPENIWYTYGSTEDIDEIINEHLINGRLVNRLLTVR